MRHSSFYRSVNDAGGSLIPSEEPEPLNMLGDMALMMSRKVRDEINKRPDILWPLGDVEITLVNNLTFNAFAHHHDGEEGIGVFAGLFYLLCDLSFVMWSHPKFLCRTHPLQEENIDLSVILERVRPLRDHRSWTTLVGVAPGNAERERRALSTALTAFMFIFSHEVGHLVRAHIPHLQACENLSSNTLLEHGPTVGERSNLMRFLETDADIYAARFLADNALTTWKMGRLFPVNYPMDRGELLNYITDIAMGLSLAFFCLDLGSTSHNLQSDSTHPTPGLRLYVAYLAMMELLWKPFGVPVRESLTRCLEGFVEVRDFWNIVGLPVYTLDNDPLQIAELANHSYDEHDKIKSRLFSAMDSRLQKFGTSLAYYDQFASFYD